MRVLRRRVAAMSPREKYLAILSALGLVTLSFYYIPAFLYLTLFVIVCSILWYYYNGELLPTRFGLYPRAGFNVPVGLRRRLWGWGVAGVSAARQRRTKSSKNKAEIREPESNFGERFGVTGIYRGGSESDSFLFSPRDFLMGSYIGKPESPAAASGRPRAARNPREQLRERLSRPNHAVSTPNRRLSFAGEAPGALGRFTITPQRHYPLQQPGVLSVGVLPPVRWDGFRKKSILTPRNSPGVLSPVTVKIARPDHHSSPSVDHLSCAGLPKSPADPCSRESVLRVLKETRKRNEEDEDRGLTAEQRNKRRRNDSGGSAHSAFEPLLPNGTPSQLVPKPGSLKRGMASLVEESTMKRSRTSSISSGAGFHAPRGTPGTTRNPIHSSYSSTLGLSQRKRPAPSPSVSSPGSSRPQTPEGALKRPREEEGHSPSSASSGKSDQAVSEKAPAPSELSPVPKVPVTASVDSPGSGGKRKRKIQLVPSHRDDAISLPPPPELGYTVTVKDLDEEKKAAIDKIQKMLEAPAPEPEKPPPEPAPPQLSSSSSTTSSSTSTTTLSSLLTAPLPTSCSPAIPVINLDPGPAASVVPAPAASTPLLEALKMKSGSPISSASTVSAAAVVTPTSLAQPPGSKPDVPSVTPQLAPVSQPQSSSPGVSLAPAFPRLPGPVSAASSATPPPGSSGLFGPTGQSAAPASSSNPAVASASSSPLLASGFKPIFAVAPAAAPTAAPPEVKPSAQTFKPIFGGATAGAGFQVPPVTAAKPASARSPSITSSIFGPISSTTVAPSIFSSMTNTLAGTTATSSVSTAPNASQPALKSLFGNWATPTTAGTSSVPALASNAGSTFQFGAANTPSSSSSSSSSSTTTAAAVPAPATTSSSNSAFTFGATQPDSRAAKQKVFAFGPVAPGQNNAGASFGGFSAASTAAAAAATAAQPAFSFGKPSFQAPSTQPVFGSATQATFSSSASQPQPKAFTFGGAGASSTAASNSAPAPFAFGAAAAAAAATTASSFVTPTKPAFGASSAGFAFGTSAPSAAPAAAPSFGASSQTPAATSGAFTFGGTPATQTPSAPALAAPSGYNFGAAAPQFGTQVSSSPAPQMGGFSFGPAATDKPFGTSTPPFGQSAAPGPIPFGSPAQGFNSVPFGSSPTPSFSIGAGPKPSGARQRAPARRQHNRKK